MYLYLYTTHTVISETISKMNNYNIRKIMHVIASHNCLKLSCHFGPYTIRFSCSWNLTQLLVAGGAMGVVATFLLERGEFRGS
jgi:hypothetical protein